MKQSLQLVSLQIINTVVSIITLIYVAKEVKPAEYSIIAVMNVIAMVIVVFSNTGLETIAIRNILNWQKQHNFRKMEVFISQSILLRIIFAFCLQIFILPYAFFLSASKYDGYYFSLFVAFGFYGIFMALNDSMRLILNAFNLYIYAALNQTFVNTFGRTLGLIIFFYKGLDYYIYTLMLIPVLASIPLLIYLNKWIKLKNLFNISLITTNMKYSSPFIFNSYLSYVYNQLDQLLVSIFLSSTILASFSIAKNVIYMGKSFIENIFDNLMQKLISYKINLEILNQKLKTIMSIQKKILYLGAIIVVFGFVFFDNILIVLHLSKYNYLGVYLSFALLSQLLYLAFKIKLNFIHLFYKPSTILKITVMISISSLVFLSMMFIIRTEKYLYSYLILTNTITYFIVNYIYSKNDGISYLQKNTNIL